jgi:hypothetical protein
MPDRAPDRPELCLEDIDFHNRRHVSLLAMLSQSNHFYYFDRTSFLNFKDGRPRVSPTGTTHGILAFERSKQSKSSGKNGEGKFEKARVDAGP